MKYKPELGLFGNMMRAYEELTKTNNNIFNNKYELDSKIAQNLAEADEIAINLYEANLAQEIINAEQDEAIIEIFEKMEATNNG